MAKATEGIDLTGHRILISGAAGGIGSAAARACAHLGGELILSDVAPLGALADELAGAGVPVTIQACDVSDRGAVESMAAAVGDIDALVAAGGIQPFDDWHDAEFNENFHRVMDVNVLGPLNLARAWLDPMIAAGYGRMVIVGSLAGRIGGLVAPPHYVASKGAVHALVRWLANRGAPHGVMVNAMVPGPVDTPMMTGAPFNVDRFPMKRLGRPDEIGWPIAMLASPAASFMAGALLDANGAVAFG